MAWADYAVAARIVRQWYPARPLAMETALGDQSPGLDSAITLHLAEILHLPLVTKHASVFRRQVPVLRC